MDNEEVARRADRRKRFLAEQQATLLVSSRPSETLVEARAALGTSAQGQNKNLEKDYLRLTSHPDVADVRPPRVLEQALDLIKQKWREGECSYKYACDQLKSIRQDLTVQHVRNALTVAVYETHARIAIEIGDWAELRQSLAVLGTLYVELGNEHKKDSKGGEGDGNNSSEIKKKKKRKLDEVASGNNEDKNEASTKGLQNQSEFMAYNLMLAAATGRSVLAHELKECASRGCLEEQSSPFINHAFKACTAASSTGDFVALLKLYDNAPRMAPYLLDLLVEKTRPKAYSTILAAFGGGAGSGPTGLPLGKLAAWLGFAKRKEAAAWIRERGGVLIRVEEVDNGSSRDGGKVLDSKASREGLRNYLATAGAAGAGTSASPPGNTIY
jgi:SAC3 family protein LENG8/THP3